MHSQTHAITQPQPLPTCHKVIDFLMAYIDGELPADERASFERHLSVCPSCVNYMRGYRTTVALAKASGWATQEALATDIPDSLVKAVLAARHQ